jgi:hypothetical protein
MASLTNSQIKYELSNLGTKEGILEFFDDLSYTEIELLYNTLNIYNEFYEMSIRDDIIFNCLKISYKKKRKIICKEVLKKYNS